MAAERARRAAFDGGCRGSMSFFTDLALDTDTKRGQQRHKANSKAKAIKRLRRLIKFHYLFTLLLKTSYGTVLDNLIRKSEQWSVKAESGAQEK